MDAEKTNDEWNADNPPLESREALSRWMESDLCWPELTALRGVAEREDYHPEGNSWIHMGLVMDMAFTAGLSREEKLAALTHDIGKAVTGGVSPWPDGSIRALPGKSHNGHDTLGETMAKALFERERLPASCLALCMAVCALHQRVHTLEKTGKGGLAGLLREFEGRRPDGVGTADFTRAAARVCEADARGRLGLADKDYPQASALTRAAAAWESESSPESLERDAADRSLRSSALARFREEEDAGGGSETERWKRAKARLNAETEAGRLPGEPRGRENAAWETFGRKQAARRPA